MARRLEELEPGTPVYCGATRIGEVRGVYAEGDANLAEYLALYWDSRREDVLIATKDVQSIDDHGVILVGTDAQAYANSPAFNPASRPTIRKIK